jgi:hypothetical protein
LVDSIAVLAEAPLTVQKEKLAAMKVGSSSTAISSVEAPTKGHAGLALIEHEGFPNHFCKFNICCVQVISVKPPANPHEHWIKSLLSIDFIYFSN